MDYQVTVRYGTTRLSYHTFHLKAGGIAEALREAADALPHEVARQGDLVEIRPAASAEERTYLGQEEG